VPQKSGRETGAWQSPASEREGYTRKALAEELIDPDKVTPLKSDPVAGLSVEAGE
jgi:hypothetical protein